MQKLFYESEIESGVCNVPLAGGLQGSSKQRDKQTDIETETGRKFQSPCGAGRGKPINTLSDKPRAMGVGILRLSGSSLMLLKDLHAQAKV